MLSTSKLTFLVVTFQMRGKRLARDVPLMKLNAVCCAATKPCIIALAGSHVGGGCVPLQEPELRNSRRMGAAIEVQVNISCIIYC
jgi:hypothetical protein